MTWPIPALLAWAAAWGLFGGLQKFSAPIGVAVVLATALGGVLSVLASTRWRRVFVAAGFPISLLASGWATALPAWSWLLPLAVLLTAYPLRAWRDAPLFPTPMGALRGLAKLAPLPERARILDAGCGLGDALRELRAEHPHATLQGLEWSWGLRWLCAWRCRLMRVPASVKRGDIWTTDWSAYDMVYLFQRPESMPRAVQKAAGELRCGAWLASLEFEATELKANAVLRCPDGRPVWLYQMPFKRLR